jgi:hypothetical protein
VNAKERRQEAIGMISELYLPTREPDGAYRDEPVYLINYWAAHYATSAEVADNIEKLIQLGRTDRWQAAIKRWAAMVRHAKKLDDIRYAFLQGMIYAGHASE